MATRGGTRGRVRLLRGVVIAACFGALQAAAAGPAPRDPAAPPERPIRLVFVHHSVGENWLADEHGGLGRALDANRYFVSDTNYGWGPDGIGDRTDIPDWPAWFTGPASGRVLDALLREGGTHAPYARTQADPGGPNRIVLFKSCYPNSELEGRPDDAALRGEGLTVANAKAVYDELLTAFARRPETLFVAITAPPVRDAAHAANARAFTTWLATRWLAQYAGANVAVFDLFNVLTGPDNHHRVVDGRVERVVTPGRDTLHYPSEDDHPSPAGSRKATAEFVPWLNLVVRRWLEDPRTPAAASPAAPADAPRPAPAVAPPAGSGPAGPAVASLEDFEHGAEAWQVFTDGPDTRATRTLEKAGAHVGAAALRLDVDVAPGGWTTCALVYDGPRDWSAHGGLVVYLRAQRAGQQVDVIAYEGTSPDALGHREVRLDLPAAAVTDWHRVEIPWARLVQPAWEGEGGARFDPRRALGVAFGFPAGEGARRTERLWVDDLGFLPAGP